MKSSRIFAILVIAALMASFFYFDLGQYLQLDYLKSQRDNFLSLYENYPLQTISIYMLIYILSTALSLPGATILTLAGGAVFGLTAGTIIVSFASTIGASFAFLASRFILRDSIESKFGDRLQTINKGLEKDGAFYLFSLRLIPVVPFFVINLVMGLTKLPLFTFFWVSQLGMFAGTIAYVNAGTQLSQLDSLKGILSPSLIASFAFIGVLPIFAKKLVSILNASKVYKKFKKPRKFDYNLLVIGAGAGGLVSAYIGAAVKAKVGLIEKEKMGGDCLNTGCVPSKALIQSCKMLSYAKRSEEFGFKSTKVDFDFSDLMHRVQNVIKKIEPHDSVERYTELGVECIKGFAKILSPWEIQVGDKVLTTKNIVIAAGAGPLVPDFPGLENINYYTTDTIWNIRSQPKSLVILGAGPIGCELGQCFQRLGTKVTIIEMADKALTREDDDVGTLVVERLEKEGICFKTAHKAKSFTLKGDKKVIVCEHNAQEVEIECDDILFALGRKARVSGYGLEELGIDLTNRGTIEVNEFLQTKYPNIYVAGDVTGPYQFTHVASHQAWFCAVNALFSPFKKFKVDYRVIPWVTFCDPEIARVGLNEKEAKEKNIAYELTSYNIDDLDRAIADSEAHGVVKVLTVPGKDKILGATIVSCHAGELITEFVAAMKHGYGLNKILGTIHAYPTWSEANKYAAGAWKRGNKPEGLLTYVEKFHSMRR